MSEIGQAAEKSASTAANAIHSAEVISTAAAANMSANTASTAANAVSAAGSAKNGISNALETVKSKAVSVASDVKATAQSAVSAIGGGISNGLIPILRQAGTAISQGGKKIINPNTIKNAISAVKGAMEGLENISNQNSGWASMGYPPAQGAYESAQASMRGLDEVLGSLEQIQQDVGDSATDTSQRMISAAQTTANATEESIHEVENSMNSAADDAGNDSGKIINDMNDVGNEAQQTSRRVQSAGNGMGMSFSKIGSMMNRMILRMFIFHTIIAGIRNFNSFMGSALMTNSAFANSLAQVRSNLVVAFMPIYSAILPALTSLMAWLARATQYIAIFISALFGKTYSASVGAAKNLEASRGAMEKLGSASSGAGGKVRKAADDTKKAANEIKESLAGFDEINKLSQNKQEGIGAAAVPSVGGGGGGASLPSDIWPVIDTSPTQAAIERITAAAKVQAGYERIRPNYFGSHWFLSGL